MLKEIVIRQYKNIVNSAAESSNTLPFPNEGWLCTVRKALGMSVVHLAKKLNKTRAHIYKLEQAELEGRINIKTMKAVADAMHCKLVYCVVPKKGNIDDILDSYAQKKAEDIVMMTNRQMALEGQLLPDGQIQYEIERIKKEILDKMPKDFWE